jgi:hypothetical protein
MQLFARPNPPTPEGLTEGALAAIARPRNRSGSDIPSNPSEPARNNSRRLNAVERK